MFFSDEVDIEYIKSEYPEMRGYEDRSILDCVNKLSDRGLSTCCYDSREGLQNRINEYMCSHPDELELLEIGPLDNPFFIGDNVKYFDVLDSVDLQIKAKEAGRIGEVPNKIDYVSPNGDLGIVNKKFQIVFSSHVIEHQVDLLEHLNQIENILKDNGLYVLLIPDKRYCFDYYRSLSTIADIIEANVSNRKLHSLKNVIEHFCLTTHNNAVLHWMGYHGEYTLNKRSFIKVIDRYENSENNYIDVHAWRFTPESFGAIVHELGDLGLITLKLHRLCHTLWGRQEFCAILRK